MEQGSVITSTKATWEALSGLLGMGAGLWPGVLGEPSGLLGSQDGHHPVRLHQSSEMPTSLFQNALVSLGRAPVNRPSPDNSCWCFACLCPTYGARVRRFTGVFARRLPVGEQQAELGVDSRASDGKARAASAQEAASLDRVW